MRVSYPHSHYIFKKIPAKEHSGEYLPIHGKNLKKPW